MTGLPFAVAGGLPAGLGPIKQIGFITTDIPASVAYWARTFGAGPFFQMDHVDLRNVKYYGKPVELDESLVLGYWHDIQIEFIIQHNKSQTIYTDWMEGRRQGVHHFLVDSPDVEKTRADLAKEGLEVAMEAKIGAGGEVLFFDMKNPYLPYLEVVRLDPSFTRLFDYMQRAARDWDGKAPLRPVPAPSEWA